MTLNKDNMVRRAGNNRNVVKIPTFLITVLLYKLDDDIILWLIFLMLEKIFLDIKK